MPLLLFMTTLASPARAAEPDPAVIYANAHRTGDIGYREGWFGKGDAQLHYVVAGQGPLIVLYHGFPSFWFSWFDQMEALKGQYRVVAVDGLGAGLSAKPAGLEPYKIANLAKQLDGLARHLNGRKRFILIGHDWGAALALSYAQAYPKRLEAVIGLSAPSYNLFLEIVETDAEQQARSQYMQRFRALTLEDIRRRQLGVQIAQSAYADLLADGSLTPEEHALFITRLSDPETMNAGMNWYRANIGDFAKLDQQPRWPRHNRPIRPPLLLLWGGQDQTFVATVPKKMRSHAVKAEVVTFADIGHWTSMEQPDDANATILAFLSKIVR
jgi:epoxide hydrolase 4